MAATDVATQSISATSIPRSSTSRRGSSIATSPRAAATTSPSSRARADHVSPGAGQRQSVGNALREVLDVRIEERVLLLLLDCPEFVYCFFGAIKIGAVPVPTNTLLKSPDYEYILNDCRARVVIVSEALLPQLQAIPRERLRYLREVVVVGNAPDGTRSFASLMAQARRSSRPSRPARTTAPSGCTRRAAPASPRAASICTTTWWCAPSCTAAGCSASPSATAATAWPSCFSPTAWATGCISRSASARRRALSRPAHAGERLRDHRQASADTVLFGADQLRQLLAHEAEAADFSSVRWGVSAGEACRPPSSSVSSRASG